MADAQADPTDVEEMAGTDETRSWGTKLLQLLTAVLLAGIIAVFGAWATANLGIAGPVAAVLFLLSAVWLYRKPIPSAAIGNGLYRRSRESASGLDPEDECRQRLTYQR